MGVELREVRDSDHDDCSRIVFEAFKGIADLRNFPWDFPSVEAAGELIGAWLASPDVWGVVAERDGRVVGSNFLEMSGPVAGVGPITVDPAEQSRGVGRSLMLAVMERGEGRPVRLVQDSANTVSLPLYASLGFDVKEPLVRISGQPSGEAPGSAEVRPLTDDDVEKCAELCRQVHGFDRAGEVAGALQGPFQPFVCVRDGRVVAYATNVAFWPLAHGVAETHEDMVSLLTGACRDGGAPLDILLPIRDAKLFRWALDAGLRVVKPMNLMALRDYHEPQGAWFPSVLF